MHLGEGGTPFTVGAQARLQVTTTGNPPVPLNVTTIDPIYGLRLPNSQFMTGLVYGPGSAFNTVPDERVALQDLKAAARVYARTIVATCM